MQSKFYSARLKSASTDTEQNEMHGTKNNIHVRNGNGYRNSDDDKLFIPLYYKSNQLQQGTSQLLR